MTKINNVLTRATQSLSHTSETPQLDAEILLANMLNEPRSYLHAYPEQEIPQQQLMIFKSLINRRKSGEPVAYILGYKEFWSLEIEIDRNVLIPRLETELLVELALTKLPTKTKINIADLGTGSGAIALALASERPQWKICATDKSAQAINIAKKNARQLNIKNINFYQSDWCSSLPKISFSAIISNPPYICEDDPCLKTDIKFEPLSALVSGKNGLQAIRSIITQAKNKLSKSGFLMLEHGYDQANPVKTIMELNGYINIQTFKDLAEHDRITIGYKGG